MNIHTTIEVVFCVVLVCYGCKQWG